MSEELVGGILVPWQGQQIELGFSVQGGAIVIHPDEYDGDLRELAEWIAGALVRSAGLA